MKRILTIAGSDSGGGAGIQADIKTITVLGGYAMSAITALTAQNTLGVQGVHPVPVAFVRRQLDSVLSDIGVDAVKTGMLVDAEIVQAVAEVLRRRQPPVLVVDPVMVAKSGDPLLTEAARDSLKRDLIPLALVITPNLPEASVLAGFPVTDEDSMRRAAAAIHDLGARMVLVKGGHLAGLALDILFDGSRYHRFEGARLEQRNTHGTGCTLSAALATFLAQGQDPVEAVKNAKAFTRRAIANGLALGSGHGPTNHYAAIAHLITRQQVLERLQAAVQQLLRAPIGRFIPEVRSNLAYALPNAAGPDDVAAVPGRISQTGDLLLALREPAFGASRHIAKVVLAAMSRDPGVRSAMNLRFSESLIEAARRAGLKIASFDRAEEPEEVKLKEGSTLEWGTLKALESAAEMVDLIYDRGEVGKEPMLRVLGRDPAEVVAKVLRIWAQANAAAAA